MTGRGWKSWNRSCLNLCPNSARIFTLEGKGGGGRGGRRRGGGGR